MFSISSIYPFNPKLNSTITYKNSTVSKEEKSGLFIIDQKGLIRHTLVNDLPIGRSVDEAYRVLSALKYFEEHGEVCPADWEEGDDTID
uniref:thioredoxin-dependent peroxiredoxin n=1 Tax=Meloidogyne floridensis TaxID=298350 RepID=A0A915NQY5_9BILA